MIDYPIVKLLTTKLPTV